MEEIARKLFVSLVIESEYEDCIFCIVLVDGYFCNRIMASNRNEAIKYFNDHTWTMHA